MTRLRLSLLAAVTTIAVCSTPAFATDVPIYQGTAFFTAVAGTCASDGVAVGDYATMIYRQQPRPSVSSYGGAIAFVSRRSAVSYVMPASTALNSGNQPSVSAYGESSLVGPYNYTGAFNLTISNPAGPAPGVTITGTVADIYDYTGCTVTIEASLALRP